METILQTTTYLEQLPSDFNFAQNELEVLKYWDLNNTYKNIVTQREKENAPHYQFVDGPPFSSSAGLHWGHIHISMMKSSNNNYRTMQGYHVLNKMGYDNHGLPIELIANKDLQLKTNADVKNYGIANYNKYCVDMINGFMGAWHPIFDRVGRFFDKTNEYRTMDTNYMESVWWIFKQLWEKDLVYRGYKIMPYSIECGTSLSASEATGDEVYKEISDLSVYLKFRILSSKGFPENTYFVAWTTTPWTLPSNLVLAMNPKMEYVRIRDNKKNEEYIVSSSCLERLYPSQIGVTNPFTILSTHKGEEFDQISYEPPFPYLTEEKSNNEKIFRVYMANFVDDSSGTGIVHISPAHGQEDFDLCINKQIVKIEDVGKYCLIDENGFFTDKVTDFKIPVKGESESFVSKDFKIPVKGESESFVSKDFKIPVKRESESFVSKDFKIPVKRESESFVSKDFKGMKIFDANLPIIKKLMEMNKLVKKENYRHRYPHCWRTDTPLIQKAVSSFYIRASALREKMVQNNEKVRWIPDQIKNTRFKQWIENASDWGVSRSRFFGNPIPVWVSDDGEEMICIGSIDELVQLANLSERPTNLHPEFLMNITIPSQRGKGNLHLCMDIFDCWFESGCVPLAQHHYPFENKSIVDNIIQSGYLSEFVCEGADQVNKWFYVLTVISTALFDIPAFKNVICNGLILSETGEKFSKRLNNFVPPMELCNEIGSDALRMYFIGSPASHGGSFTFDRSKINEINLKYFQWFNSTKFFIEHHTKYVKDGNSFSVDSYKESDNVTDKWILARLGEILTNINSSMDEYLLYKVKGEILGFVEDLTNWYIKFNRNRLRGRYCNAREQGVALSTLYRVLFEFTKITAPFVPFLSETLYLKLKDLTRNLFKNQEEKTSVHACYYPKVEDFPKENETIRRMKRLQQVARMVRSLRSKSNKFSSAKVPLKNVTIVNEDKEFLDDLKFFEKYMYEELNALNITYSDSVEVKYKVIPDSKLIGQKYKKRSNEIKQKLLALSQQEIKSYLEKNLDVLKSSFHENLSERKILKLENGEDIDGKMFNVVKDEALSLREYELGLADGQCVVIVNANYDSEVIEKYLMRLFIVSVQKLRKNSSLRPWNKIGIYYQTDSDVIVRTIESNLKLINEELLYEVKRVNSREEIHEQVVISMQTELEGEKVAITITDQYSN
jgi:isoleucyl-tRNA synthetase